MTNLPPLVTNAENWILANWKKLLTSHTAAGALGFLAKWWFF